MGESEKKNLATVFDSISTGCHSSKLFHFPVTRTRHPSLWAPGKGNLSENPCMFILVLSWYLVS